MHLAKEVNSCSFSENFTFWIQLLKSDGEIYTQPVWTNTVDKEEGKPEELCILVVWYIIQVRICLFQMLGSGSRRKGGWIEKNSLKEIEFRFFRHSRQGRQYMDPQEGITFTCSSLLKLKSWDYIVWMIFWSKKNTCSVNKVSFALRLKLFSAKRISLLLSKTAMPHTQILYSERQNVFSPVACKSKASWWTKDCFVGFNEKCGAALMVFHFPIVFLSSLSRW